VNDILTKVFNKHKIWIDIVISFGCNRETAEDITQEMYIRLSRKLNEGLDINFGDDDYNYYYVFKILKSMFLDLKRKESKINVINIDDCYKEKLQQDVDYDVKYELIKQELDKMYWYDRKVYEILDNGDSVAALSRKTHIPYHSLYNTYRKVIERLKKLL